LLTLVVALVAVISGIGLVKLYSTHPSTAPQITVAGTPEQVARGEHIAAVLCASCHSPDKKLPLSGGKDVGKESPVPIGSLISYNLTPGGPLKEWSDGEIFQAIRVGINPQGRTLIAMSGLAPRYLSDADIEAVIAYLRSQPSVTTTAKEGDDPNLVFAIFLGANLVPPAEPVVGVVTAPEKGPTVEYGKYIVNYNGCRDCHGTDLAGGHSGGLTPVGPSLRVVKGWTADQFKITIRTGTDPSGHKLNSAIMAWDIFANMDDEELAAVYAYLTSLQ